MCKMLTRHFLDVASEVRISRVPRWTQTDGNVILHVTYGQSSTRVGTWICALEANARHLRGTVVV